MISFETTNHEDMNLRSVSFRFSLGKPSCWDAGNLFAVKMDGGLEHVLFIYIFPYIGNFRIPTDELIFFREVYHQPVMFFAPYRYLRRFATATARSVQDHPMRLDHRDETTGGPALCYGQNRPFTVPICSMYGIFTNIYPINHPNVRKYTIHGAYVV